jgi:hypothetical protein
VVYLLANIKFKNSLCQCHNHTVRTDHMTDLFSDHSWELEVNSLSGWFLSFQVVSSILFHWSGEKMILYNLVTKYYTKYMHMLYAFPQSLCYEFHHCRSITSTICVG